MDSLKNIEFISKIGENITSTLNLEEVIKILHTSLNAIMDAEGFVIYIHNPEQKTLDVKYKFGKHAHVVENSIPLSSESSFCVHSLKNKTEMFINDVRKEYSKYISSFYWASASDEEIIHSFINIPLIIRGESFGVISVQSFNKNSYTKEHLEILKSLASYMSIAFNNAETYSQLNSAKETLTEQKRIIEEKNNDIMASIRYAKRIQQSLLPTEKYIDKLLKDLRKK